MNVKYFVLFISGLAVGGAAGVLGSKKYFENKYQKKYEEDMDSMQSYYNLRDEYIREISDNTDENEVNPPSIWIEDGETKSGGRMSSEERASIKERLKKNYEETTNYAAMYRFRDDQNESIDPAEAEHPEDNQEELICEYCMHYNYDGYCNLIGESTNKDDSCSDFVSEFSKITPEEEAFDEHQKNMNKPPRIISADAYSNLSPHIEKSVLYFYTLDETLCDENEEEIIEDPEILIGDSLTKYGFIENDERIIFVMNYATETCYEIQKVDASWTDSH